MTNDRYSSRGLRLTVGTESQRGRHLRARLLASVAVAACLAPVALAQEARTKSTVSYLLTRKPLYCAKVSPEREICTWHEIERHHRVCEFDSEGAPLKECLRIPDNDTMEVYPPAPLEKPSVKTRHLSAAKLRARAAKVHRAAMEDAARAEIAAVDGLDAMISFVGSGPVWCEGPADALNCGWRAIRATPNYPTLARAAAANGKKLDLVCKFTPGGTDCRVGVMGRVR